jgi:hypothetical protein
VRASNLSSPGKTLWGEQYITPVESSVRLTAGDKTMPSELGPFGSTSMPEKESLMPTPLPPTLPPNASEQLAAYLARYTWDRVEVSMSIGRWTSFFGLKNGFELSEDLSVLRQTTAWRLMGLELAIYRLYSAPPAPTIEKG